jgi:hypothetical protein
MTHQIDITLLYAKGHLSRIKKSINDLKDTKIIHSILKKLIYKNNSKMNQKLLQIHQMTKIKIYVKNLIFQTPKNGTFSNVISSKFTEYKKRTAITSSKDM